MEMRHQLTDQLKRLKMPGLSHALDMRLAESRTNNLGHLEFLSLLIQDELVNREDNMLGKRLKAAGFGVQKSFEDFDFRFNEEALPAAVLRDLATCHFLEQKQNLVIGGPPGIGKTHAVKAIGHEAARRGYQVLFRTTQKLLAEMQADSSQRAERILRRAVAVDLLILD
jgi:DNA replication protein DnaC